MPKLEQSVYSYMYDELEEILYTLNAGIYSNLVADKEIYNNEIYKFCLDNECFLMNSIQNAS